MDRIENINVERIRWCCDDRGITPGELANAVNIAPLTFEAVMAGEKGLTFNQLRRIAEYFNRGLLFFVEEGEVTAEDVYTPQFRTIANQKPALPGDLKALVERVERQRDVYLALREDLEQEERLFDPPDFPEDPAAAANITRAWLGLSTENTFDEYRSALEHRGILVFRSNGYAGRWKINKGSTIAGFTVYDEACPVIFVRKEALEERQTFTMMHELGHVLLHRRSFIDEEHDLFSYADKEREANAFAGQLLIPDKRLATIDLIGKPYNVDQLSEWLGPYRTRWGVSGEVILRRLLDAGLIAKEEYDGYRAWSREWAVESRPGGSRVWRHREPKHMFGETFVRTVLDALNAHYITLAKASTYLDNIKVKDIHKLEGYYAGL